MSPQQGGFTPFTSPVVTLVWMQGQLSVMTTKMLLVFQHSTDCSCRASVGFPSHLQNTYMRSLGEQWTSSLHEGAAVCTDNSSCKISASFLSFREASILQDLPRSVGFPSHLQVVM